MCPLRSALGEVAIPSRKAEPFAYRFHINLPELHEFNAYPFLLIL